MNPIIRWMERKDMAECALIDAQHFSPAVRWTKEDFINELHEKNIIGQVVELRGDIIAFYIYMLQTKQIVLLHMAVDKDYLGQGVGTLMIDNVKKKLRHGRRERIIAPVRESLLGAHLFMQDNKFRAIKVVKENYMDTNEDAYVFRYDLVQAHTQEGVEVSS